MKRAGKYIVLIITKKIISGFFIYCKVPAKISGRIKEIYRKSAIEKVNQVGF
jgi:hypothetical protein